MRYGMGIMGYLGKGGSKRKGGRDTVHTTEGGIKIIILRRYHDPPLDIDRCRCSALEMNSMSIY